MFSVACVQIPCVWLQAVLVSALNFIENDNIHALHVLLVAKNLLLKLFDAHLREQCATGSQATQGTSTDMVLCLEATLGHEKEKRITNSAAVRYTRATHVAQQHPFFRNLPRD